MKRLFNLIVIFSAAIILIAACTPEGRQRRAENRIAKIVKKFPGIAKTDSIVKDTTLPVAPVKASVEINTKSDTAAVDTLTKKFEGKVQQEILDTLNKGFKKILKRSGNIDTTIKKGNTTVRFKKDGDKTTIDIEAQPDSVKFKYVEKRTTITPPAPLKWHERILLKIGKKTIAMLGGFLLLLILLLVYRFIKKEFFD